MRTPFTLPLLFLASLTFFYSCESAVDDVAFEPQLSETEAIVTFYETYLELETLQRSHFLNYSRAERAVLNKQERSQYNAYENALWQEAKRQVESDQPYDREEWLAYKERLSEQFFTEDIAAYREQRRRWTQQYMILRDDLTMIINEEIAYYYPHLAGKPIYSVYNWLKKENLLPTDSVPFDSK